MNGISNSSFESGSDATSWTSNQEQRLEDSDEAYSGTYYMNLNQYKYLDQLVWIDSDEVVYFEAYHREENIRLYVYYVGGGSSSKFCDYDLTSGAYDRCYWNSGFTANKVINKVRVYSYGNFNDIDLVRLYYDGGRGPS